MRKIRTRIVLRISIVPATLQSSPHSSALRRPRGRSVGPAQGTAPLHGCLPLNRRLGYPDGWLVVRPPCCLGKGSRQGQSGEGIEDGAAGVRGGSVEMGCARGPGGADGSNAGATAGSCHGAGSASIGSGLDPRGGEPSTGPRAVARGTTGTAKPIRGASSLPHELDVRCGNSACGITSAKRRIRNVTNPSRDHANELWLRCRRPLELDIDGDGLLPD